MSWFPGFNGTMSRSDCSLPIPSSSVSSALGTFCPDALVRSEHPPIGWLMLGLARISAEPHAVFAKEARALPGSWAALMHVPRSTTPVEHLSPTTRPKYVAFRPLKDVGSHDEQHFGAQSRGPYTPCVRFTLTALVNPRPANNSGHRFGSRDTSVGESSAAVSFRLSGRAGASIGSIS